MIGKDKTRLILTVPKDEAKKLKNLAKKKKCPVSEYIRNAIFFYMSFEDSVKQKNKTEKKESPIPTPEKKPDLKDIPPELREFMPSSPSEETRKKAKAKKAKKRKKRR
jgi:hypothetical protein